jgi:hypothetical protein
MKMETLKNNPGGRQGEPAQAPDNAPAIPRAYQRSTPETGQHLILISGFLAILRNRFHKIASFRPEANTPISFKNEQELKAAF